MRVLLTVLLTVSSVNAYDAVVFSNEQKITEDYPSIENLLSTASAQSPLVFIVNPDFTLGQFSREAHAYSTDRNVTGLPAVVKSTNYYAARYLRHPIYAPGAVFLTSADEFSSGEEVYVVAGEDWTDMEILATNFLENRSDYTAVITSTEAVTRNKTRVKRVATSEMEDDAPQAAGPDMDMPMVLPPYNRSQYPDVKPGVQALGSCMLYLEGVNIIVQNSKKVFATIPVRSLTNTTSWSYADGDVKCSNATNGTYTFSVRLKLKGDVSDSAQRVKLNSGNQLMFTLSFGGAGGAWRLMNITADNIAVEGTGTAQFLSGKVTAQKNVVSQPSVNNMGLNSVSGYAVGCSDSQAAFFKTDQENVLIGVSVYNIEVQSFGVFPDKKTQQMYFTRQVEDCVGTFSVGSWMGILSTIFMLTGFFFGFLMLNSVQTMDRFDDPKHKQIVINVRE